MGFGNPQKLKHTYTHVLKPKPSSRQPPLPRPNPPPPKDPLGWGPRHKWGAILRLFAFNSGEAWKGGGQQEAMINPFSKFTGSAY